MTRNRYPGINPHFNSYLQHVKGWKGFHSAHLVHLSEAIDPALPPGYYTTLEDSLQFSAKNERTGSDILVVRKSDAPESTPAVQPAISTPTLMLSVFEDDEFVPAVVIYRGDAPVTRLELLSPANKPPGSHHDSYIKKREDTLLEGLRLVEIDYLHECRPIIDRIPSYLHQDKDAYPYYIAVSDPRRIYGLHIFGFGILDKLPTLAIPLDGEDVVEIDFNQVYHHTFNSRAEFYDIRTDETQPPPNLSAYSPSDQTLILQHMAKINTTPST